MEFDINFCIKNKKIIKKKRKCLHLYPKVAFHRVVIITDEIYNKDKDLYYKHNKEIQ